MNLYPLGKLLCSAIFYPLYRIKVIGAENFPKEGGVLLCTNHNANVDPPVVGITCESVSTVSIAKAGIVIVSADISF